MGLRLATIGVYGWAEDAFFSALVDARVDLFCDIRSRRGVRGSTYAFVNSTKLQEKLRSLGIGYRHFRELAPSDQARAAQHRHDALHGFGKRSREVLGPAFIEAYQAERLNDLDVDGFLESLGPAIQTAAFFCVERDAAACHRSLLAQKIANSHSLGVIHLTP